MALRKRGNSYYCYWREGGKHYQKCVGTDLRYAKIKQAEIEKRLIDKKNGLQQDLPWKEFVGKFLMFSQSNVAKDTIVRMKTVFNNFDKTLQIRMLSDLTPELLEEFKLARKNLGLQATTINREITTIKTAMKQAAVWGYISPNIFGIRKLPEVKKHPVFFTESEIATMLNFADPYWRAVIYLGVYAGLRRGEILNLTWGKIDFKRKVLKIATSEEWHPKDREERDIPIHPDLGHYLNLWKKISNPSDSDRVIRWNGRNNIFSRNFVRMIRKAGIKTGSLHSLRHSFASHLAMQGVDLNKIREMMGHSSIITTQIYANHLPSSLPDAIGKFPSIRLDAKKEGTSENGIEDSKSNGEPGSIP